MDPKKIRNEKLGKQVVEALKKRYFDAHYVSTKEEVLPLVLKMIPKEHTVSWGGTMTYEELGIKEELKKQGYSVIDRYTAKTPEERAEMQRQALTCGTFLMSSNAITESGELFNIDGAANRVAALCYGPKNVLIVAGINKIVYDIEDAYKKVRHYTAPINAQRFDLSTPCSKTGECGNCVSQDCICAQLVMTRLSKPAGRIKVIIVGEDLGI